MEEKGRPEILNGPGWTLLYPKPCQKPSGMDRAIAKKHEWCPYGFRYGMLKSIDMCGTKNLHRMCSTKDLHDMCGTKNLHGVCGTKNLHGVFGRGRRQRPRSHSQLTRDIFQTTRKTRLMHTNVFHYMQGIALSGFIFPLNYVQ